MFIVGDIGGQFDAFKKLIEGQKGQIVLVGDLNDRGPKSKEMIQWALENKDQVTTLDSNHGDMMVDFYHGVHKYDRGDFLRNGGFATLVSYGIPTQTVIDIGFLIREAKRLIPPEHIDFLNSLPMFVEDDDVIVSHAPVHKSDLLMKDRLLRSEEKFDWFWNRREPLALDKWQVFGHNSHWGLTINDKEKWACIDASRESCLTGMYWPSRKITQVQF